MKFMVLSLVRAVSIEVRIRVSGFRTVSSTDKTNLQQEIEWTQSNQKWQWGVMEYRTHTADDGKNPPDGAGGFAGFLENQVMDVSSRSLRRD
jgi:hypothetical protein